MFKQRRALTHRDSRFDARSRDYLQQERSRPPPRILRNTRDAELYRHRRYQASQTVVPSNMVSQSIDWQLPPHERTPVVSPNVSTFQLSGSTCPHHCRFWHKSSPLEHNQSCRSIKLKPSTISDVQRVERPRSPTPSALGDARRRRRTKDSPDDQRGPILFEHIMRLPDQIGSQGQSQA